MATVLAAVLITGLGATPVACAADPDPEAEDALVFSYTLRRAGPRAEADVEIDVADERATLVRRRAPGETVGRFETALPPERGIALRAAWPEEVRAAPLRPGMARLDFMLDTGEGPRELRLPQSPPPLGAAKALVDETVALEVALAEHPLHVARLVLEAREGREVEVRLENAGPEAWTLADPVAVRLRAAAVRRPKPGVTPLPGRWEIVDTLSLGEEGRALAPGEAVTARATPGIDVDAQIRIVAEAPILLLRGDARDAEEPLALDARSKLVVLGPPGD